MSKKNRERRVGETGADAPSGGGSGVSWIPVGLALGAVVLGFLAWTDSKTMKTDTAKRFAELDQRITALQTQVANAAKAAQPPRQGPDPNKVYTVKLDGAPTHGNPTAPIVIAELSDYQ